MPVPFLELLGVLRHQDFAFRIQYDDRRKAEPRRLPVPLIDRRIAPPIHIDKNHHVRLLQSSRDARIRTEQRVQSDAPYTPIRTELHQHPLTLPLRRDQSGLDLFRSIRLPVVRSHMDRCENRAHRQTSMRQSILLLLALTSSAFADPSDLIAEASALFKERDWKRTATFLQAHPIRDWPEKERAEALRMKALSLSFSKMGAEADATLREAIQHQPNVPDWWILLGDNLKLNFTDRTTDERDAYQQALRLCGASLGWQRFTAAIALAKHHTDEANAAESLRILAPFNELSGIPRPWLVRIRRAQGHALASLGEDTAALAKFEEALQLEMP